MGPHVLELLPWTEQWFGLGIPFWHVSPRIKWGLLFQLFLMTAFKPVSFGGTFPYRDEVMASASSKIRLTKWRALPHYFLEFKNLCCGTSSIKNIIAWCGNTRRVRTFQTRNTHSYLAIPQREHSYAVHVDSPFHIITGMSPVLVMHKIAKIARKTYRLTK